MNASFILLRGLRRCHANADVEIPDRMKDGYGINEHLIRYAYEEGVDTILTCDNGIAAVEQTKLAKSLGMTILITDHHEVQEEIPPADAVVNPRQADCPYPFKHLCGAAVAYKVICCLYEAYGIPKEETEEFLEFARFCNRRGCHGSDRGKSDPGQRRFKAAEPYTECRDGIPDPCLRTGRKRDQILPYRGLYWDRASTLAEDWTLQNAL